MEMGRSGLVGLNNGQLMEIIDQFNLVEIVNGPPTDPTLITVGHMLYYMNVQWVTYYWQVKWCGHATPMHTHSNTRVCTICRNVL